MAGLSGCWWVAWTAGVLAEQWAAWKVGMTGDGKDYWMVYLKDNSLVAMTVSWRVVLRVGLLVVGLVVE